MTLDLVVDGPAGLREMRSELGALLQRCDIDRILAGDIVLAASELATNGFRHAAADTVWVESSITSDSIELTVRHSEAPANRRDGRLEPVVPGEIRVGGRGLKLVDQICSWRQVDIDGGERSTRVSFVRS